MSDLENYSRAQRERHPAPADDPISRLDHVISVYGLTSESQRVGPAVLATSNVYGPAIQTGLWYSDLPALREIIRDQAVLIERLTARVAELENGTPARRVPLAEVEAEMGENPDAT